MKNSGYILVTIGFIWASLISVTDVLEVNWINFIISMIVCVAGIYLIRSSEKSATGDHETQSTNMKSIEENLNHIVAHVKKIRLEIDPQNPQQVHTKIDELLPVHIEDFVDARKSIGHVHGLNAYADVMNYFATGERYLNRVWSASTDGYIDEVTMYMERCEEQFESALKSLKELK